MGDYELYHASTRKHKYIKKIGNRYFYTQEEIAAYLKGKKGAVGIEKGEWIDGSGPKMSKYYKLNLKDDEGVKRGVGVAVGNKSISVFNEMNNKQVEKKYGKNQATRRIGRLRSSYDPDAGSYHTLHLDKKNYKERVKEDEQFAKEARKHNWGYEYTDVGKDLKSKRSKAAKAASKHINKPINSLKKQSAKGKKAIDRWNKKRAPKVEVIQSISEDKNYKRKNGQRG